MGKRNAIAERNAHAHNMRDNFLSSCTWNRHTHACTREHKNVVSKINDFRIWKLCIGFPVNVNKNLIYCVRSRIRNLFFFVQCRVVRGCPWVDSTIKMWNPQMNNILEMSNWIALRRSIDWAASIWIRNYMQVYIVQKLTLKTMADCGALIFVLFALSLTVNSKHACHQRINCKCNFCPLFPHLFLHPFVWDNFIFERMHISSWRGARST